METNDFTKVDGAIITKQVSESLRVLQADGNYMLNLHREHLADAICFLVVMYDYIPTAYHTKLRNSINNLAAVREETGNLAAGN